MPPSYPPRDVTAFRSERIVLTVRHDQDRFKVAQVMFHRDGSLFVSFPCFRHRTGLLSSAVIPANGRQESMVSLERGGKIASHDVKYAHHPDGRAHFSQDAKIFTKIVRQSVALERQEGHIFTIFAQGFDAFDRATAPRDADGITPQRAVVTLDLGAGPIDMAR